jgi:uncharacterized membrane protein YidH (DUF202 family)
MMMMMAMMMGPRWMTNDRLMRVKEVQYQRPMTTCVFPPMMIMVVVHLIVMLARELQQLQY